MRALTLVALSLFAIYGLVEAWPLLAGPALSIETPVDLATVPDGIVTVRGNARRVATLMLNGAPLLHNADGEFVETLTFPPETSILTLIATDRFGRSISATRTVFVPD